MALPSKLCFMSPGDRRQLDEHRTGHHPPRAATASRRFPPPTLVDVRREELRPRPHVIAGAIKRAPETVADGRSASIPGARSSCTACRATRSAGRRRGAAPALIRRAPSRGRARGLARERRRKSRLRRADALGHARAAEDRPHRVSLALRRFIDPAAEFSYVPPRKFAALPPSTARRRSTCLTSLRPQRRACSFDAFIRIHASPMRGSTASRPSCAAPIPVCRRWRRTAGLLAASPGLSALFADDHAMLRAGMMMYDALYLWCRERERVRCGGCTTAKRAGEHASVRACAAHRRSRGLALLAPPRASSASAARPGRSRSCIASWSTTGGGSPSGASCTRSTTAWCCPAPRRSSSRPTSAGSCTARGAASSRARSSSCRRSRSSSRSRGSTWRTATFLPSRACFTA